MFLIPDSWYTLKTLKKKGRGAFAMRDIPPGTVIGDYLGTIIPFDSADETKDGLYDMSAGADYDIMADRNKKGIQLINHSCANNCGVYPHDGHMLYFSLRKIFKGEEITVDYGLYAPDDDKVTCRMHACYCESAFCGGTMHETWVSLDEWNALVAKNFAKKYKKLPGKYGTELAPLASYPATITDDHPTIYHMFGSETKHPFVCRDALLPSVAELRKRIRKTGLRLSFPKIHITIDGLRNGKLLAEHG